MLPSQIESDSGNVYVLSYKVNGKCDWYYKTCWFSDVCLKYTHYTFLNIFTHKLGGFPYSYVYRWNNLTVCWCCECESSAAFKAFPVLSSCHATCPPQQLLSHGDSLSQTLLPNSISELRWAVGALRPLPRCLQWSTRLKGLFFQDSIREHSE